MCTQGRRDGPRSRVRFHAGATCGAYLQRAAIQRGHAVVVRRGRHAAEDKDPGAWPEDESRTDVAALRALLGRARKVTLPSHTNTRSGVTLPA